MNKARQVRKALGLNKSQCGIQLLGYKGNQGCRSWKRWEDGKNPTAATTALFDVILILNEAERKETPGAEKALELVMAGLRGRG